MHLVTLFHIIVIPSEIKHLKCSKQVRFQIVTAFLVLTWIKQKTRSTPRKVVVITAVKTSWILGNMKKKKL